LPSVSTSGLREVKTSRHGDDPRRFFGREGIRDELLRGHRRLESLNHCSLCLPLIATFVFKTLEPYPYHLLRAATRPIQIRVRDFARHLEIPAMMWAIVYCMSKSCLLGSWLMNDADFRLALASRVRKPFTAISS
jgi:hypothetical protein